MFIRQFEYLIALAEEQHFGRAAERCHVSQPSLSNAIKQMELELGVPIVRRSKHFLGLTSEGERVANWARLIIAYRNAMRDELAALYDNLQGRLRLGAMPTSSPVVPLFTDHLRRRHPGVRVDIEFLGIETLRVRLGDFSVDAGITYLSHIDLAGLNTLPIYFERLSLAVPERSHPGKATNITWQEAAELRLALLRPSMHERRIVDEAFDKVGKQPQPIIESESILHLLFHVMVSDVATIVPSHYARMPGVFPGIRMLDLVDPVVGEEVGLVWAKGEPVMPMAQAMVATMQHLKRSGELKESLGEFAII